MLITKLITKKSLLVVLLILIGFAVYSFNLGNPLFWDDDEWIKSNVYVHDFSHVKEVFTQNILSGFGLNSNYYRPLLLLSFAFNYLLGGIKPIGYHLVSNGFHIAGGVLVFVLLCSVINRRAAFLAALLFLIHPLQTEAVTYISGRGDPMSVFFMLLALWLFIKTHLWPSQDQKWRRLWWLGASLFSMVLAILSRETAVLLPLLLMVFYTSFLYHRNPELTGNRENQHKPYNFLIALKASFVKAIPFFLVSAVYMILRLTVFNFENTLNFYSQANEYTQHLSYRLYTFGEVLIEYFKLIFVPVGLHMERDLPVKTSLFQWPVPLAVTILAAIIFIGIVLFKRSKKLAPSSYNLTSRLWFFSWSWFFVAMAPVSGIIPINALIYEHWLYLPLIGFFAFAAFYLDKFLDFLKSRSAIGYKLLTVVLVGYLGFFAAAAAKRNLAWGNAESFYQNILKYNPNSVRVLNNLGNLYSGRGELTKATDVYQRAISSPSGNIFAQPHYNLGNIYRDRGETERAVEEYKKAIAIDPAFPFAYQNLAVIYAHKGELKEAASALEKVKELRPSEPGVYYNLALVYLAQKENKLAIENLLAGLKVSKKDPEVMVLIKSLLDQLGVKN